MQPFNTTGLVRALNQSGYSADRAEQDQQRGQRTRNDSQASEAC